MNMVRATVEWLFDEIKASKYFGFKSQAKTGLGSLGKIYLVCGILENTETCLSGNKVAD